MGTTQGDITDGTLDCGDVGVAQFIIVQDHSGAILQVLQCVGQSGTGDRSVPAGEVVCTVIHVDMACDVGCPTTPQTDQLQQQQDKYLQIAEEETGGRERERINTNLWISGACVVNAVTLTQ